MAGYATIFIEFVLAEDHGFEAQDSDLAARWSYIFQPITTVSGWARAVVGCGVEDPRNVMIVSDWYSEAAFSDFIGTPKGLKFYSDLAKISRDPPRTRQIRFLFPPVDCMYEAAAEVHAIDFPQGSRHSVESALEQARIMDGLFGFRMGCTPRHIRNRIPCRSGSLIGWVVRDDQGDGYEDSCDQAIWIYTWRSAKKEKAFKEKWTETALSPSDPDWNEETPEVPIGEAFKKRLEWLGSTNIATQHFNFHEVVQEW